MKKTPWYPCSIKPVRNGWYEVQLWGVDSGRCRFSGGRWRRWDNGEDATGAALPGWADNDKWRGLSSEAE